MVQDHGLLGRYEHHSGKIYTLKNITNLVASKVGWDVMAVYHDDKGEWWSRPLQEFLESCKKM